MRELSGSFAAIVTPFTDDGMEVSEIRVARLVRRLVSQGVEGLVIASQTGEFPTMTGAERKALAEVVVREAQGAVPVLVNIAMASTAGSLDLAQHASRHGAAAVVVSPPTHNRFSQHELENHVRTVAQYAHLPTVLVDPSGALGGETLTRLRETPGLFVAVPLDEPDLAVEPGVTRSDEFRWDGVTTSSLAMFPTTVDRRRVAGAMARYGRARTAKLLFEALDFDLGGPRQPMLPLVGEARSEVVSIVS